jgi:threonine aldolase
MARLLESGMRAVPGVKVLRPCQANSVFAKLNPAMDRKLRRAGWLYHTFIGESGARFMCSWSTREDDVRALLGAMRRP